MSSRGDVTNFDVKIPDDVKEPTKEAQQMERQLRHIVRLPSDDGVLGPIGSAVLIRSHQVEARQPATDSRVDSTGGWMRSGDMTCAYTKKSGASQPSNMEGKSVG